LGIFAPVHRPASTSAASAASPSTSELPPFARVLAHARTNYEPPDVGITGAVNEENKDPATAAVPAAKPVAAEPGPAGSPSERALLERLGERRDELQQRTREIDMRERLLENAEKKLEGRMNELKAIEEQSDAAATKRGNNEAGALRNLVTMYEAMKPKDAARVFDRLSHDVLVPVVLQMKPAKMAEVLAAMSPEAAEKLTVALANRAKGFSADNRSAGATGLPAGELPSIDTPAPPAKR
jgi:flagellar motility protein MotE (MotC chaperone)